MLILFLLFCPNFIGKKKKNRFFFLSSFFERKKKTPSFTTPFFSLLLTKKICEFLIFLKKKFFSKHKFFWSNVLTRTPQKNFLSKSFFSSKVTLWEKETFSESSFCQVVWDIAHHTSSSLLSQKSFVWVKNNNATLSEESLRQKKRRGEKKFFSLPFFKNSPSFLFPFLSSFDSDCPPLAFFFLGEPPFFFFFWEEKKKEKGKKKARGDKPHTAQAFARQASS